MNPCNPNKHFMNGVFIPGLWKQEGKNTSDRSNKNKMTNHFSHHFVALNFSTEWIISFMHHDHDHIRYYQSIYTIVLLEISSLYQYQILCGYSSPLNHISFIKYIDSCPWGSDCRETFEFSTKNTSCDITFLQMDGFIQWLVQFPPH